MGWLAQKQNLQALFSTHLVPFLSVLNCCSPNKNMQSLDFEKQRLMDYVFQQKVVYVTPQPRKSWTVLIQFVENGHVQQS
jgi:hypothetical protein